MAGKDICGAGDNSAVTPCQLGITPQPHPPESQDVRMNPLPGCVQ